MLRLAGILIGSALAVALLAIVVGVPEFEPQPEDPVEGAVGGAVGASLLANDSETERESTNALADETDALIEEIFAPEPEPVAAEAAPTAADATPVGNVEEHWYAFWSPFRSEIAANGFINKLQATTGIDYRVVKIETGVYEVAFAYVDDADIQDKLARISSATGLDMTGS